VDDRLAEKLDCCVSNDPDCCPLDSPPCRQACQKHTKLNVFNQRILRQNSRGAAPVKSTLLHGNLRAVATKTPASQAWLYHRQPNHQLIPSTVKLCGETAPWMRQFYLKINL